jgi:hypothetical protein
VDPGAVVAALLKRISDLTYENAVLSAAVDQLRDQVKVQAAGSVSESAGT